MDCATHPRHVPRTGRAAPADGRFDLTLYAALFLGVLVSLLGCLLLLARVHTYHDLPPPGAQARQGPAAPSARPASAAARQAHPVRSAAPAAAAPPPTGAR